MDGRSVRDLQQVHDTRGGAAVFDCDGLLVDSAHCWERAYRTIAIAHGRPLAAIDLTAPAGVSVAAAATHLSHQLQSEVDEQRLRRALTDSFLAHPPPALPGARALIAALAPRMPLAVASNAPRDIVLRVLEQLSIQRIFDVVVSAEQTAAHKPAPDVYLEACQRLGVAPSDAIAFEDSPLGARAARSAGLVVVAVPSAPGMRIDADLTVSRLNDPRLATYLGLDVAETSKNGRPTVHDLHR